MKKFPQWGVPSTAGDPFAWNSTADDFYSVPVLAPAADFTLFEAVPGQNDLAIYNPNWQSATIGMLPQKNSTVLSFTVRPSPQNNTWGFQKEVSAAMQLATFTPEDSVAFTAWASQNETVTLRLITTSGQAFAQKVLLSPQRSTQRFALAGFRRDSALLLPRPYPGFQPLYFSSGDYTPLQPAALNKLQLSFSSNSPMNIYVEAMRLQKK